MIAIILCLILVVAIALAVELLRMSGSGEQSSDAAALHRAVGRLASYEPMRRLFAREEFSVVAGHPKLQEKLGSQRRKAMRLYLRRLRRDFMQVWSTCRLLAPVSADPEFVFNLMRSWAEFHGLYVLLELRLAIGYWGSIETDLGRMADSLIGMRGQASGLLQSSAKPLTRAAGA